eukprot:TRINITY_DN2548_c0_g2_i3.p1 TRINITY_DN2548_c0_g2~~TRINITY_DN2548_c0_g2_i3.p1  ORF type:complete len:745 (-),score=218.62 TRINITY_DN2548_c0_g2_i3:53-2053(-)
MKNTLEKQEKAEAIAEEVELPEEEAIEKRTAEERLDKLGRLAEVALLKHSESSKSNPQLSSSKKRLEETIKDLQHKTTTLRNIIHSMPSGKWHVLYGLKPVSPIPILKETLELAMKTVDNAAKKSQMKKQAGDAAATNNKNDSTSSPSSSSTNDSTVVSQQEIELQISLNSEFEVLVRVITFQLTFILEIFSVDFSFEGLKRIYELEQHPAFTKLILGKASTLKRHIGKIADILSTANATFIKSGEYNNAVAQSVMVFGGFCYYGAFTGAAKNKFESSQMVVDQSRLKKLWNLPDTSSTVRMWTKMTLPTITVNKKVQIPITSSTPSSEAPPLSTTRSRSFSLPAIFLPTPPPTNLPSSISARILCYRNLPLVKSRRSKDGPLTLVIHYHGGGFIAMSSFSHQDYTRKWAKYLDEEIPSAILSVDYRLAPDYPYPTPVDDCFDAYKWAIENSHTIFGRPADKFIVTGDSAGGNLSAVIALKAIHHGLRIPDGVVLSYPVLNMCRDAALPARVLSIRDPILAYAFLDKVMKCYLTADAKPRTDPFLSPSLASDELLSKFPPTYILTGNSDPLHHDSYEFANRLLDLKKFVRIYVYEGLPHGYLSFANKVGASVPEARRTLRDAVNCMVRLVRGDYEQVEALSLPSNKKSSSSSSSSSSSASKKAAAE